MGTTVECETLSESLFGTDFTRGGSRFVGMFFISILKRVGLFHSQGRRDIPTTHN